MSLKSSLTDVFLYGALLALIVYHLPKPIKKETPKVRKYQVKLSSTHKYYEYDCDSIIRISDKRIMLKNNEDSTSFVDITLPDGVIIQVYKK